MSLKPLQVQYISGAHRKMRRMGIYVHVPFCVRKCNYCDFYSTTELNFKDAYTKALITDLKRSRCDLAGAYVETIYFGGGTPTLLGVKNLSAILKKIRRYYDVADDAEITFETNPAILSREDFQKLRIEGFNRVSIGVQSFDDDELRNLGRIHNARQAAECYENARSAGFTNISLDIMFGLPGQKEETLRRTLQAAIALGPEHISYYGLKIEDGTPFGKMRSKLDLPDDDKYAKFYLSGVQMLEGSGYAQYEISNFAKGGFASRHNLKYWKLNEYAGFGPAAHSYLDFKRFGIEKDISSYVNTILRGGTPRRVEEEDVEPSAQLREYVMMSLRLTEGINRMVYSARFGHSFAAADKFFERLETAGLAKRTEQGWALTPKGFLVSNSVILSLHEFLDAEDIKK